MTDEKFEEFLQREAKAYNPPPAAVPREEMWQVIAHARAAQRGHGASTVTPLAPRRPRIRVYAPLIGMAATLLLGVGIGRFVMQSSPEAVQISGVSQEQLTPDTAMPSAGNGGSAAPGSSLADGASEGTAPTRAGDTSTPAREVPVRRAPAGTRVLAAAPAASAGAAASDATESDDGAMDFVSREHLGRAEALISVVAATPRDATMDSLTAHWAREMLSGTRLLLDSPAGDDPVRRRLLEDLETLLVQLVQRSGGPVDERELIDRTLERTQLLTRLRTGAAGI